MIGDGSSANVFNSEALMLHASCRRSIARLLMNRSRYTRTSAASDSDLPLNFHPAALRASAGFGLLPNVGPPEGRVFRAFIPSAGWMRRRES
jgi:hypothetical protein